MDRILSEKEKIDLLFAYLKGLSKAFKISEAKNTDTFRKKFFTYLINLYDYNKFPVVVKDDVFQQIQEEIVYRGCLQNEHNANTLCDFDYHYGIGKEGSGIYATKRQKYAYLYGNKQYENIMTFKFTGKTIPLKEYFQYRSLDRIFGCEEKLPELEDEKTRELHNILKEEVSKLTPEEANLFNEIIRKDNSIIPILLGYDGFEGYEIFVIFNREKIVVNESEFNRICNASEKYQGGIINFDKKEEKDFLRE